MKLISLLFFMLGIVWTMPSMTSFHLQKLSNRLNTFQYHLRKHFNQKRVQKLAKRLPNYIQLHDTIVPARLLYAPRLDYM